MEFHLIDSKFQGFKDFTLILPTLSFGNVSQLAIDLILLNSQAIKIGILDHSCLSPFIGNDCISPDQTNSGQINTSMEVYVKEKFAIIQQRSPVFLMYGKLFATDLMNWIQQQNFANIIFVTGADASFRTDKMITNKQIIYQMNMTKSGIDLNFDFHNFNEIEWKNRSLIRSCGLFHRYIDEIVLENEKENEKENENENENDQNQKIQIESQMENLSIEPKETKLGFVALILFCYEGDNFYESELMAQAINQLTNLITLKPNEWKKPYSWNFLVGREVDAAIY
ncbi:proteasome assembly chaperone 2 [Anaeramoeba ignava]|uniref:Proteasome assembly chaperone 2 n=1 Tax=Anaeramoeba ignava TaxID=1746090 RepID=A0A9Q0L884_ANAIG|nr:proteasome assembly chaperone 2 [Anaeramoeba ignava]